MTILITGANGTVSKEVLRSLEGTADLRVLVRDRAKAPSGAEVAVGDLHHPETLDQAFKGVDAVWLLNAMGPDSAHASSNALWAAKKAGVRHIVRMSAIGAGHDAPTRNGRLHVLSDLELAGSGLGWTVIRPANFMQNILGSVNGDTFYGAPGEGRIGMIDVRDIADFAALVLRDPTPHQGEIYTLTGPERIRLRDMTDTLSEVYGRPLTYQPISPDDAYPMLLEAGLKEWDAAVTKEYMTAYDAGWGDYTTPTYTDVTGRPGRTFAQFARDYADQIGG
ncbi:nucleotide-diphosphate-sugar epimerase [Acrocarpospora phusangensis]|uniref:Nucleotide-diphosphate-sugar epimerase n=1 Tax=Acrocarpospora phusangensis TaxID=1070424 RepID=A0A919UNH5_9ACTN|nr:NAD(P)H-binding protein [Acrocarpospora phusangensis]GIH22700.1 nucleotide-diphosphate-sugar epimerase [Acrocarpospora phusangensis]